MAGPASKRLRFILIALVVGVGAFGAAAYVGWMRPVLADAPIGNGYLAGWMCSGVFAASPNTCMPSRRGAGNYRCNTEKSFRGG